MLSRLVIPMSAVLLLSILYVPRVGATTLENPSPGSFQSGIGVISGWACDAQTIELSFDGGPRLRAGTGTIREDTQDVCGDTDNGFSLLYNWNLLEDGVHTVTAYADGVEFASVPVTVTTLGEEFRRGLSREAMILDFPESGSNVVVEWQEASQNFVITFFEAEPPKPPEKCKFNVYLETYRPDQPCCGRRNYTVCRAVPSTYREIRFESCRDIVDNYCAALEDHYEEHIPEETFNACGISLLDEDVDTDYPGNCSE